MKENWIYRRGDIYYANLGSRKGSEQGGKRPVVVIQNNSGNRHAPTLTVLPVTSALKKTNQPTHYVFEGKAPLKGLSMVMAEQMQTIDKSRIVSYVAKLDDVQMQRVERAVRIHLGLETP